MALTAVEIQRAYIAFFNRPADVPGMNHWLSYQGDAQDLLNEFAQSDEYLSDFAGLDNAGMVTKVYNNLFGRNPEMTGLSYWVAQMDAGYVTIANVAHEIMGGAQNEDATIIDNKVAVAQSFTEALVSPEQQAAYNDAGANGMGGEAKAWLSHIDESTESVAAARAELPNLVQSLVDADQGGVTPPQPGDNTIWLGGDNPTISGTDGNDTFVAQTAQLQDNTILDGKGGNDTLEATMRVDDAIAATTTNIEKVVIRAQDGNSIVGPDNNIVDGATVDADRMVGVNWWESKNSRSDVKIEDVRILDNQITKDITVAFRESDPGHVDYALYFDQSSLRNQTSTSGVLVAALFDSKGNDDEGKPLRDNPYTKILFEVDGTLYTVDFGVVNADATFQDLRDAVQAAINANSTLAALNINVELVEGVTFYVPSDTATARANAGYYLQIESAGHTIGEGGWATGTGFLPPTISTQARQDASNPTTSSLVTSSVVLDYVGRGSMGGDLVIGGLSTGYTSQSKGVQQFDVTVERDSKLEVVSSTNNTLQVVNLVNSGTYNYLGAYERGSNAGARSGDLTIKGDSNVATLFGKPVGQLADPSAALADQDIDGAGAQQNNGYGLTDVQVLNGTAFRGNLDVNAYLSENVVGKYMNLKDQAPNAATADNAVFNYSLGAGNDKLDLAISSANLAAAGTATREDFVVNVDGGAGNDVISTAITEIDATPLSPTLGQPILAAAATDATPWYANHKLNANLHIDAGSGNDTINTMGSGDWSVELGTGNDTYYADNTAARAVWVFNTANQDRTNDVEAERALDDLVSGDNASYILVNDGTMVAGNDGFDGTTEMAGLYGLKLRVVLSDVSISSNVTPAAGGQGTFISQVVSVPTTAPNSYRVTDLQINQAIKQAINSDPVLSKLLVATDGPSNTLVVTSLTDGARVDVNDLGIEFAIPDAVAANEVNAWRGALGMTDDWTAAEIQEGRIASFNALLNNNTVAWSDTLTAGLVSDYNDWGANAGTGYTDWYSANLAGATEEGSYAAAYANDGTNALEGAASVHATDNIVIVDGAASDVDVVVLSSSTLGNDTVKWDGSFSNGTVKVVNFDTDTAVGTDEDWLDFSAYGARWLGVAQKDTNGFVAGTNGWDISQDAIGLHSTAAGAAGDALPTFATSTYLGDFAVKAGDKYITLTRDLVPNPADDDGVTLYKIELWTVAGTAADAYLETLAAGDTRDSSQLIGYVDLGRTIEGVVDADSILAHIDLF